MPARRFSRAVLGSLVLVGLLGCGDGHRPPESLLLVTLDTLRADHLGVYGYDRPTSLRLDEFASRATVFEDVVCGMPTTLPSHLTILSGLTTAQHGVSRNGMSTEVSLYSLLGELGAAGRRTAAVVSAGVLAANQLPPLGLGEVVYRGDAASGHQVPAAETVDDALAWLRTAPRKPFALWVHFYDPHEPYTPSAEHAARFDHGYDGDLPDALPTELLVALNDPEERAALGPDDLRHVVDLYDAEVADLDRQLGRLFDGLAEAGLDERTAVVIVADHGQAHGENDFFGHGALLIEPVIRVPLLVRLPGQREGRRVATPVETRDVAPTVAELFGLARDSRWTGRSLGPALRGERLPSVVRLVERRSYAERPLERGLALLRGDDKLVYYRDGDGVETFHHGRTDGAGGLDGENLWDPDARPMDRRFVELAEQVGEARPSADDALSPETRAMLRSLGYL